jgi:hypothetical protein
MSDFRFSRAARAGLRSASGPAAPDGFSTPASKGASPGSRRKSVGEVERPARCGGRIFRMIDRHEVSARGAFPRRRRNCFGRRFGGQAAGGPKTDRQCATCLKWPQATRPSESRANAEEESKLAAAWAPLSGQIPHRESRRTRRAMFPRSAAGRRKIASILPTPREFPGHRPVCADRVPRHPIFPPLT